MAKRWSQKRPNHSHLGTRPFGDNSECVIPPGHLEAVGNRFARRRMAAEERRRQRKEKHRHG